jgi:hypothetical protein
MKVSLSSLNTLLEQAESESDIILSADRGDFQDAFKGDPYDYTYNAEEDVFTVIGLNSKREKLSDKKVARLEKSVGARLGSSSKAYDVLKKRMGKSERAPTKKKKAISKGQKLSMEFLKTSSVNGKRLSPDQINLTLALLSDSDISDLSKVADNPGKYAKAVQDTSREVVTMWAEIWPLIEGGEVVLGAGAAAASKSAAVAGAAPKVAAAAGAIASWPGIIIAAVATGAGAWYASGQLEDLEKSEAEVVLMDIRPLMAEHEPKSKKELTLLLSKADSDFMSGKEELSDKDVEDLMSILD